MEKNSQIIMSSKSPLFKAIVKGYLPDIDYILSTLKIPPNSIIDSFNNQNTFFYSALIKDDNQALKVFKYFYSKGINPSKKDKNEQTCLFYTCREGKKICCNYLVNKCKLNINEKDIFGQTAIFYCVRGNKINTTKLMIKLGADLNIQDIFGQSCLYYAIKESYKDIVELLLWAGAKVDMIDKSGRSPFIFAKCYGCDDICDILVKNGSKDFDIGFGYKSPFCKQNLDFNIKEIKNYYLPEENSEEENEVISVFENNNDNNSNKEENNEKNNKNKNINRKNVLIKPIICFEENNNNSKSNDSNKENLSVIDIDQKNMNFIGKKRKNSCQMFLKLKKVKKYYISKIDFKGKRVPLSYEELEIFKKDYNDIYEYLLNEEKVIMGDDYNYNSIKENKEDKDNKDISINWRNNANKLINLFSKSKNIDILNNKNNIFSLDNIRKKLLSYKYDSLNAFKADMNLLFNKSLILYQIDPESVKIITELNELYKELCLEYGGHKID